MLRRATMLATATDRLPLAQAALALAGLSALSWAVLVCIVLAVRAAL